MSGFSEIVDCPRCGSESLERSVDSDEISGCCLECGYEYHTVFSTMTPDEVNDERLGLELEPLTELKSPKEEWSMP